ncbi:MAG: 7-carboxy-7-deazaguanine synthase QueE [Campylobacteraceae bacterium]|nr:7-carboxy-7-deazaguanine synthase QueE [Campylobacteraceae bacterium]
MLFTKAAGEQPMISVVESFLSIQGEGRYVGTPSLFVRFGGCNLSCKGFGCEFISPLDNSTLVGCDSLYAVDKKHFGSSWEEYDDAQKLFEHISFLVYGTASLPHLVITGGEPLIHHKNPIFYDFLKLSLDKGFKVFMETNASIDVDFEKFPLYKEVGFAMSVKLSNSGESYEKRVNKTAITNIAAHAREAFFKFVLDAEMIKSGEAKSQIDDIIKNTHLSVFCMPLGKNSEEIEKNCYDIISFCIKSGYNYADRIHIRLWGEKRGV